MAAAWLSLHARTRTRFGQLLSGHGDRDREQRLNALFAADPRVDTHSSCRCRRSQKEWSGSRGMARAVPLARRDGREAVTGRRRRRPDVVLGW